ncbi:MAG: hypothetical protein ABIG61_07305 [Planctomycetota bacterium]
MASGIATIKISTTYKGVGEGHAFTKEFTVSGITNRPGNNGLLSTQSTTISKGLMSAGIYGIQITNTSTTILNSTTSAGLFVFFSGQGYLSGLKLLVGETNHFRPAIPGRGIKLYSPRGGNAFEFTAYGI